MRWPWGKRGAEKAAPIRVSEIVASDAFERFGPVYLTIDVHGFVHELLQVAKLPKQAIPSEAVLSAAVQTYIGEVENGGQNGFKGNSQWNAELRNEIRAGLDLIGLDDVARIFAELEAYEKSDPDKFHAADWTDPVLQNLDDRMRPLCPEAHRIHADWLLSLSNMRIVPDADYPRARRAIIDSVRGSLRRSS
jgi:hypothetical protein